MLGNFMSRPYPPRGIFTPSSTQLFYDICLYPSSPLFFCYLRPPSEVDLSVYFPFLLYSNVKRIFNILFRTSNRIPLMLFPFFAYRLFLFPQFYQRTLSSPQPPITIFDKPLSAARFWARLLCCETRNPILFLNLDKPPPSHFFFPPLIWEEKRASFWGSFLFPNTGEIHPFAHTLDHNSQDHRLFSFPLLQRTRPLKSPILLVPEGLRPFECPVLWWKVGGLPP